MRFSGAWRVGSAGEVGEVGRARVNGGDSDRREEKTEKETRDGRGRIRVPVHTSEWGID